MKKLSALCTTLKRARRDKKYHGEIDWNLSAQTVHNKIRGLYSWPCAVTYINGKKVKLLSSRKADGFAGKPGEVLLGEDRLVIACGEGAVEILRLQAEGKKAMDAASYLRGNPLKKGFVL